MAANLGKLEYAKGFGSWFSKHDKGVITAKDGTTSLKRGYVQDANTHVVSKGTSWTDKAKRSPINTALIAGGVGLGGTYAYNSFAGGGGGADSFERAPE